jgi:hypothetical protein
VDSKEALMDMLENWKDQGCHLEGGE